MNETNEPSALLSELPEAVLGGSKDREATEEERERERAGRNSARRAWNSAAEIPVTAGRDMGR